VARALGEPVGAAARESVVSTPQLLTGVDVPVCAAQPFAVEELGSGEVNGNARAAQPLDRFPVHGLGCLPLGDQGA
jgi:hypothetical protein